MERIDVYRMLLNKAYYLVENFELYEDIDPEEFAKVGLAIATTENRQYIPDIPPNKYGATGLMQVKPIAKRDVERRILKIPAKPDSYLLDPDYNSFIAMAFFGYQLKRYGLNYKKAIMSYHDGHYNPSSKVGTKYYNIVMDFYNKIDYDSLRNEIASKSSIESNIIEANDYMLNNDNNVLLSLLLIAGGIGIIYLIKRLV